MDDALTLARHGGSNDKFAPAIDRAKTIVAASKRAGEPPGRLTDAVAGLGGIGAAESTLSYIAKIHQPDVRRRIAQQQEQHDAAENAAKRLCKN
jgi:hypothetical protein